MTFLKRHGVRLAGWLYLAGNALLFAVGVGGGGWAKVVASLLFVVAGVAYARNYYRLGGAGGLVGMVFFIPTLPPGVATAWMAGCAIPALLLNATEGIFRENVRPVVSVLMITSRIPMLAASWGTPVMGVAILWLAADVALGVGTPPKAKNAG